MKGIKCCEECAYYNMKKYKCTAGAEDPGKAEDSFYTDCPHVEAEPVRHAEWDCIYDDGGVYRCSACGEEWYLEAGTPKENNMNYCPTCGAKMDGGDDNG